MQSYFSLNPCGYSGVRDIPVTILPYRRTSIITFMVNFLEKKLKRIFANAKSHNLIGGGSYKALHVIYFFSCTIFFYILHAMSWLKYFPSKIQVWIVNFPHNFFINNFRCYLSDVTMRVPIWFQNTKIFFFHPFTSIIIILNV